jgi:GNAT superfamily N-acetyltransferase
LSGKKVIRLTKTHVKPATETLAQSLNEYPLFTTFIPNLTERKVKLPILFEFMIRFGIRYGEVHATSSNFEAVALWFPSENAEWTALKMIRVGGFALIYYYLRNISVMSKLMTYNEYAFEIHNRQASFPHWYLALLGTKPNCQGQGYARKLLQYMFTCIDKENMPAYLETHDRENIPIYQHFGFQIVEEEIVPDTDVFHYAMLRKR